jgi:hypothetical protein
VRWSPAWELVSWSNELIVGQLPAGKNVSIVRMRHQATTGEETAD